MGGVTPAIHHGGPRLRRSQRTGRLAEPDDHRPHGVASAQVHLSTAGQLLRSARGRSLCHPGECTTAEVFLQILNSRGGGGQRPVQQVASRSPVRVPSFASASQSHQEDAGGEGRATTSGSALAWCAFCNACSVRLSSGLSSS